MEALVVKERGILFKIARFGKMDEDGYITDKGIEKQNKLLRELYHGDAITSLEYTARKQDSWRPVNFCEFSRYVLWGVFLGLAAVVTVGALATWVIGGTVATIYWLFTGHVWAIVNNGHGWYSGFVFSGLFLWAMLVVAGIGWGIDAGIRTYRKIRRKRLNVAMQAPEIAKVEERLRRRQLRRAFWDSIRNKTCFKIKFE